MPFPLSKIELHIDDELIAAAETILQQQLLSNILESDPGLWVAEILSDPKVEVEVLVKKGQVKAHTCECGQSTKKTYCPHSVALLLHLLERKKKEPVKTVKSAVPKIPKRITVSYLLDLIQIEDLKQFVKEYAREDRHFGLLLKAHFAHLLPRTEDHEPIGQALANTIKAIKKPGKTLSRTDWKMLQKVLKTFLAQGEEALYNKHYADVFEITEAILQQLSPMLLMTEDRKIFREAISDALSLLGEVTKVSLAPELEEEIWKLTMSEAETRVYYFYDLWQPLGNLALQLAKTKERSTQLLALFEEKSQDNFVIKHPPISAGIVNFKIQLFELQHNDAALKRYLEENISHPEVLKQAIGQARKLENWPQLEQLSLFALQKESIALEKTELTEQLLTAARFLKKKKKVRQLSQQLFLETFDFKYFEILKETAGKKWMDWKTVLLKEFKKLPAHVNQIKVLAQLFAREEMIDELSSHLKESLSLDLLREYDTILFQQDDYKTALLYETIIDHYLDNYVGRPAAVKVRESLMHLKEINQNKLANSLMKFVKKKYGDRRSLLEALAEM